MPETTSNSAGAAVGRKGYCVRILGTIADTDDLVLAVYMQENWAETAGPFRSIYLEGPSIRGDNDCDYITEVAVPIKEQMGCLWNEDRQMGGRTLNRLFHRNWFSFLHQPLLR